ncbi:BMP family ABC transporter substrate-binding protein [Saliterribacillus persicus]|uniref:Nucleoside-binding protein n=1 Tax=Saliterribacillus persicus TaxID=930114 RepID=A0A368XC84_9BACI|nr:BMP family ABC transporter substrate-binding protein [Saliterribacillus persicus]RCW64836.1 nucleoside-binding protein [Saliterribacillus persicus]
MENKKQVKWILWTTIGVTILIIGIILFKSTQILNNMNAKEIVPLEISILTTDVVTDQSWGSLAYKGQILIEENYQANATLHSELDESEIETKLHDILKNPKDLIIGHGREFSEAFNKVADSYPDVQFVTIHGDNLADNLAVYTYDHQEIEYLAGIAAAIKTTKKKVGLIDAIDNIDKDWGFRTGLEEIDPDIELLYGVAEGRENKVKAVEIAKNMIDAGVDILYAKGNSYNKAVFNYAKDKDVYLLGYLEDQSYMAKDKMLTSVLNDVPQAYVAIMDDFISEEGIASKKVMLNTSHGVYGLAPLGPMYTHQEKEIVYEHQDEILKKH